MSTSRPSELPTELSTTNPAASLTVFPPIAPGEATPSADPVTALWTDLQACRQQTLRVLATIDPALITRQAHPDFSPIGWHIGHIAYTEALWILQRWAGQPPLVPAYETLFAADGLPKADRVHLPDLTTLYAYLDQVRTQVADYWADHWADNGANDDGQTASHAHPERLWRFLLQHESQHVETLTIVHQLLRLPAPITAPRSRLCPPPWPADSRRDPFTNHRSDMVEIPGGPFQMGSETAMALDNERGCHTVNLPTYWLDRYPVTWGQYQSFIAAGGYHDRQWWSAAGWQWLQQARVQAPLQQAIEADGADHPVCGVSAYEAEAYARFAGKRLPTEAEWEKAARWDPIAGQSRTYPWGEAPPTTHHCNYGHQVGGTTPVDQYPAGQSAYGCYDLLGNVWEWTATWFAPYPGFRPYPYVGYSQAYFDQTHRVMRGGSWATYPWGLRSSFRNWYPPQVREVFVGFRCASDTPV